MVGKVTLTKTDFMDELQSLCEELGKAMADRDFERVQLIDEHRQELIRHFAAEASPDDDPEFLHSLEAVSEEITTSITQLRIEIRGLSRQASSKMKMLGGYCLNAC